LCHSVTIAEAVETGNSTDLQQFAANTRWALGNGSEGRSAGSKTMRPLDAGTYATGSIQQLTHVDDVSEIIAVCDFLVHTIDVNEHRPT
jgi:hypothetical protein